MPKLWVHTDLAQSFVTDRGCILSPQEQHKNDSESFKIIKPPQHAHFKVIEMFSLMVPLGTMHLSISTLKPVLSSIHLPNSLVLVMDLNNRASKLGILVKASLKGENDSSIFYFQSDSLVD
jgi:hypothetical protein